MLEIHWAGGKAADEIHWARGKAVDKIKEEYGERFQLLYKILKLKWMEKEISEDLELNSDDFRG